MVLIITPMIEKSGWWLRSLALALNLNFIFFVYNLHSSCEFFLILYFFVHTTFLFCESLNLHVYIVSC